ncbi:MAG: hypothetical protein B6247_30275 [Candidatus Parabeggiatoa sp. nov. 2]|nr:MAG: hypothetical protein B6247_30275 [Beggiatoa sp. 4572_84]
MKKSYWGLLAICLFYGCSTKTSQPVVAPRVSKPPSPIHEPPMEVEKPASIPCASDDDNDGVNNCNDRCVLILVHWMTTTMGSKIVMTSVQELLTGLKWILAVVVLILVHWMTTTMGSKIVMTSVPVHLLALK